MGLFWLGLLTGEILYGARLHQVERSNLILIPVFALAVFRSGRLIYRRLGDSSTAS